MKTLTTGVISEGVCNPRVVVLALRDELARLDTLEADVAVAEIDQKLFDCCDEHVGEVLEQAEEAIIDLLPPYTYLGNQEGDGACYGLWADVEQVLEEVRHGEIPQLDDVDDDYAGYVVNITDHGNVSLIHHSKGGETQEIWGVV